MEPTSGMGNSLEIAQALMLGKNVDYEEDQITGQQNNPVMLALAGKFVSTYLLNLYLAAHRGVYV